LPDKGDWGKVKRVLSHLKGTLHMPLILSADLLTLSQWWVDAAYAVHDNCRGHTGAGMSFGQGMALSYSWKQKINMNKSSTEAKLIGVDDSLGYILLGSIFYEGAEICHGSVAALSGQHDRYPTQDQREGEQFQD
jgi:hypothetical protein